MPSLNSWLLVWLQQISGDRWRVEAGSPSTPNGVDVIRTQHVPSIHFRLLLWGEIDVRGHGCACLDPLRIASVSDAISNTAHDCASDKQRDSKDA